MTTAPHDFSPSVDVPSQQRHSHRSPARSLTRMLTGVGLAALSVPFFGAQLFGSNEASTDPAPSSRQPNAQEGRAAQTGPIMAALASVDDEVRIYNDHLTILASPWMEGRLPGTRGMELAKEYMEHHYKQYGLEAPYGDHGYRQVFELSADSKFKSSTLKHELDGKVTSFEHGSQNDYTACYLGRGGDVEGEMVFVGYGIESGPGDVEFTSYNADVSLEGKVAVMLRFEPFDEEGRSSWARENQRWSRKAGFEGKLTAAKKRGAAAVIIINTPGVKDRRVNRLLPPPKSGRSTVDVPVFHMQISAGQDLIDRATGSEFSLEDLTAKANLGPVDTQLHGKIAMMADIERNAFMAENMVGVLPGRGDLAGEHIVVGAHVDHLGMGDFGSRDSRKNQGKKLHPGADDNASGAAGILLIAQKMARDYAAMPRDADLRSIIFLGFSAEESGLNGSAYFVENPLVPLENITLMMNFDMIGRMKNSRLSLAGTQTGDGLHDFIQPIIDQSPLTVVQNGRSSGGSDHAVFHAKEVPILFAIIKDFHADYHTSRDVSYLINRVEAVQAANLFYEIATAYAANSERFPFQDAAAAEKAQRESGNPRTSARLGVRPKYDTSGNETGVIVDAVTVDSPADSAGLQAGDRLISFDGEDIADARQLSEHLKGCEPGQKVKFIVIRGADEVEIEVTLGESLRGPGR